MSDTSLPDHLGGHMNKVHTDRATLLYLREKYGLQTMVDIGCGPGDMVQIADMRGMDVIGVDGDWTLENTWVALGIKNKVFLHDFTQGEFNTTSESFDLGWSVEVLEHIDEEYLPNVMELFGRCNVVIATAAPPGHGGHHHVNEQPLEYWVDKFAEVGLIYDPEETSHIRNNVSQMRKPFMQKNGMLFKKEGM